MALTVSTKIQIRFGFFVTFCGGTRLIAVAGALNILRTPLAMGDLSPRAMYLWFRSIVQVQKSRPVQIDAKGETAIAANERGLVCGTGFRLRAARKQTG